MQRQGVQLRVVCWNVLADCYSAPPNPPWSIRWGQISAVLTALAPCSEVILLQEVDHCHLENCYMLLLNSLGFEAIYLQRPGKGDGCLLAYDIEVLALVDYEELYFDDLAHLFSKPCPSLQKERGEDMGRTGIMGYRHNCFLRHNVAIIAHLKTLRAHASLSTDDINLVVAVPHLYWNPQFEDVKDSQVTYLLDRVATFRDNIFNTQGEQTREIRTIIGGDFNSLPDSNVYRILTSPFRFYNLRNSMPLFSEIKNSNKWVRTRAPSNIEMRSRYGQKLSQYLLSGESQRGQIRFLCDSSLSKFCRWLRVLGISCAMYEQPRDPGQQQPKYDHEHLFSTARNEQRVLLTTARKMMERSSCPESFFVDCKNLETSLIALFHEYDIALDMSRFLTVCGKCGGDVVTCHSEEYKAFFESKRSSESIKLSIPDDSKLLLSLCPLNIISDKNSTSEFEGVWVPENRQIFMCVGCLQPYWWSENEASSPARAMQLAYRLYTLVKKSLMNEDDAETEEQVSDLTSFPVASDDLSKVQLKQLFDFRDASLTSFSKLLGVASSSSSSCQGKSDAPTFEAAEVDIKVDINDSSCNNARPLSGQVVNEETSGCIDLKLSSVFQEVYHTEPCYTNWTESFKGTLDYIMVSSPPELSTHVEVERATVLSSVEHLNAFAKSSAKNNVEVSSVQSSNGYDAKDLFYGNMTCGPFPNIMWPSDHMLISTSVIL